MPRRDDLAQDGHEYGPHTVIRKVMLPNGLNMEYALHGSDNAPEKLVLLMGLGAEKEAWLAFIAEFFRFGRNANEYQILTPDNRGVGGSDAPLGRYTTTQMAQDTLQLIDYLGWNQVHLAGVSMGGMISQEIAYVVPERIRSLGLLVSSAGFLVSPWPERPQLSAYLSLIGNFFSTTIHERTMTLLEVLYPPVYLNDHQTSTSLYNYHFERMRVSRTRVPGLVGQYAAVLLHRMDISRLDKLRQCNFPILIIGGKKDRLLHVSHSVHLGHALAGKNTNTIILNSSGHGIHIQHKAYVVQELSAHLQRSKL